MTNNEAIEIIENMVDNMNAEGIRITREEDEAIDKLIRATKNFDILLDTLGIKPCDKKREHSIELN